MALETAHGIERRSQAGDCGAACLRPRPDHSFHFKDCERLEPEAGQIAAGDNIAGPTVAVVVGWLHRVNAGRSVGKLGRGYWAEGVIVAYRTGTGIGGSSCDLRLERSAQEDACE